MPIGPASFPRQDLAGHVKEFVGGLDKFIAGQILPIHKVPQKAGQYLRVPAAALTQKPTLGSGSRAAYPIVDYAVEEAAYATENLGVRIPVYDDERAQYSDQLDLDQMSAEIAARIVLTDWEYKAAAALFNTTTWPIAGSTGHAAATEWSMTATADQLTDVNIGVDSLHSRCGATPDRIVGVCALRVARNLMKSTDFIQKMKIDSQVMGAAVRPDLLAEYFGISRVLIGMESYNAANSGVTASLTNLWDDEYFGLYVAANTGSRLVEAQIGRTMVWDKAPNSNGGEMAITEERATDGIRADLITAAWYAGVEVFSSNFGYLISNVTA